MTTTIERIAHVLAAHDLKLDGSAGAVEVGAIPVRSASYGDECGSVKPGIRFLLIEENVRGCQPPRWVSSHTSEADARLYHRSQEYARNWEIADVVDVEAVEVPARCLPTPLRLALAVQLDELPDTLGGLPLAGPERAEAYAEATTIASEALSECQRLERALLMIWDAWDRNDPDRDDVDDRPIMSGADLVDVVGDAFQFLGIHP